MEDEVNVADIGDTLKFRVVRLVPLYESVHGLPDSSFSMNVSVCPFYIPSLALLRFPRPRCMPLGYGLCLPLSSKNCFYQEKIILLRSYEENSFQ